MLQRDSIVALKLVQLHLFNIMVVNFTHAQFSEELNLIVAEMMRIRTPIPTRILSNYSDYVLVKIR